MKRILLFLLCLSLAFLCSCASPQPLLSPQPSATSSPNSFENSGFASHQIDGAFDSEEEFFTAIKQTREADKDDPLGKIEFYLTSKNLPQGFVRGGFTVVADGYITVYYSSKEPREDYNYAVINWEMSANMKTREAEMKDRGFQKYNDIYYERVDNGDNGRAIQGYYTYDGFFLFASAPGDLTIEEFEAFCQVEKVFVK